MSHWVMCACGCGRAVPSNAPWDGMHGPSDRPATPTPEELAEYQQGEA